jgi:hypothetical protein
MEGMGVQLVDCLQKESLSNGMSHYQPYKWWQILHNSKIWPNVEQTYNYLHFKT